MKNMWAPWRLEYISKEADEIDGCIFCELPKLKNDRKTLIPYRSKLSFVILNKYPYNNGHVMVVPYKHTHNLLELDEEIQLDCIKTLNKVVRAFNKVYNPDAMNIGMNIGRAGGAGIEEHLHWHILPRWNGDTNFMPVIAGTKVISESLESTYNKLEKAFKEIEEDN